MLVLIFLISKFCYYKVCKFLSGQNNDTINNTSDSEKRLREEEAGEVRHDVAHVDKRRKMVSSVQLTLQDPITNSVLRELESQRDGWKPPGGARYTEVSVGTVEDSKQVLDSSAKSPCKPNLTEEKTKPSPLVNKSSLEYNSLQSVSKRLSSEPVKFPFETSMPVSGGIKTPLTSSTVNSEYLNSETNLGSILPAELIDSEKSDTSTFLRKVTEVSEIPPKSNTETDMKALSASQRKSYSGNDGIPNTSEEIPQLHVEEVKFTVENTKLTPDVDLSVFEHSLHDPSSDTVDSGFAEPPVLLDDLQSAIVDNDVRGSPDITSSHLHLTQTADKSELAENDEIILLSKQSDDVISPEKSFADDIKSYETQEETALNPEDLLVGMLEGTRMEGSILDLQDVKFADEDDETEQECQLLKVC